MPCLVIVLAHDVPRRPETPSHRHRAYSSLEAFKLGANNDGTTVVDTTPLAQSVVERSMYWDAGAVTWAAGTSVVGTPIP